MQVLSTLELEKQCQASCRVHIGIGGLLSRFTGLSNLPSCFESILGVTIDSLQGNLVYREWIGALGSLGMVATPLEFLSSVQLRLPPLEM